MTRSKVSLHTLPQFRDAAADDHRGPATAVAHVRQIELCVVQAWWVRRRTAPLGTNFVIQPDAMKTSLFSSQFRGFHHRGRAAQIDISIAAAQHVVGEQIGDEPCRSVPLLVRPRDDHVHLQVRDTPASALSSSSLQRSSRRWSPRRADGPVVRHLPGSAPSPGSPTVRYHRPPGPPAAQRGAGRSRPCCTATRCGHRYCAVAQIVRHDTVRQQPDDELQFIAAVGGGARRSSCATRRCREPATERTAQP